MELEAQHPGLVETLTRGSAEPPWPELEVWSFAARPDLRQVELSGPPRGGPASQSGVPADWSRPARLSPGPWRDPDASRCSGAAIPTPVPIA